MSEHIWEPYPIKEQIHISDMYTFFQVHYDSDYAFFGETHNFWECLYVIKGKLCVSADERIYYLEDGEIIFHKPNEFHRLQANGQVAPNLIVISFSCHSPLMAFFEDKILTIGETEKKLLG